MSGSNNPTIVDCICKDTTICYKILTLSCQNTPPATLFSFFRIPVTAACYPNAPLLPHPPVFRVKNRIAMINLKFNVIFPKINYAEIAPEEPKNVTKRPKPPLSS